MTERSNIGQRVPMILSSNSHWCNRELRNCLWKRIALVRYASHQIWPLRFGTRGHGIESSANSRAISTCHWQSNFIARGQDMNFKRTWLKATSIQWMFFKTSRQINQSTKHNSSDTIDRSLLHNFSFKTSVGFWMRPLVPDIEDLIDSWFN